MGKPAWRIVTPLALLIGSTIAVVPSLGAEGAAEDISSSSGTASEPDSGEPPVFAPTTAQRSSDRHTAAAEGRAQAGLNGSRSEAERLSRDPAAVERGRPWGFPVSESEFPGLVDRFDVQRGSGDVAATARALDPASYAGTWLDLSVGKIYNAYTHDAARHEPALRAAARRPDAVEVVQMPFTLGYLESSAQTIMEGRDRAASRGIEIISTSVREPLNAVVVGLPSATAGTRDEIAELFSVDRAALRLEIVPRPANDSAPFGGHAMTNGCSAGAFGFTRTSTGAINQRFLVSAAHCGDSAQHRTGGTAGGGGHAPTYNVTLQQEAGNVDAQRMLASPAEPTRVVEGWGSPDFTLDGSASLFGTYDVVGAWVCSAGYATGGVNNCGQIDSRAHSCTVAGIAFNNLGRATYTRTGGDSGGTVYGFIFGSSTVPLVGFHKGTCGGAVYSKQTYVLSAMGLAGWDANL